MMEPCFDASNSWGRRLRRGRADSEDGEVKKEYGEPETLNPTLCLMMFCI